MRLEPRRIRRIQDRGLERYLVRLTETSSAILSQIESHIENAGDERGTSARFSSHDRLAVLFGKGGVSTKVAALTEGVLKTMLLTKVKTITALLAVLGMLAVGVGLLAHLTVAAQQNQADREQKRNDPKKAADQAEQKRENQIGPRVRAGQDGMTLCPRAARFASGLRDSGKACPS
jgi:hypothetical protein